MKKKEATLEETGGTETLEDTGVTDETKNQADAPEHDRRTTPVSQWLRQLLEQPKLQNLLHQVEELGVDKQKIEDIAEQAQTEVKGFLQPLVRPVRKKPFESIALIFGAAFLLGRMGRGRS